jgi:hypothetical protein
MKRYEVCARNYAWLVERESADGLWAKYDEAAAECDELRQQLTKTNTMLLFTRAERDGLQQQLAAAQEREKLWVSVKDQMPEMSMLNKKYQVVVDAEFFAGDFCNENGEPISGNITHWYEIPEQEATGADN